MSKEELTTYLKENNLLLVNKDALLNLMAENNVNKLVDSRIKWISRNMAQKKYELSRSWFVKTEADPFSVLKVKKRPGKTAKKLYNEQSIIDELNRMCYD